MTKSGFKRSTKCDKVLVKTFPMNKIKQKMNFSRYYYM